MKHLVPFSENRNIDKGLRHLGTALFGGNISKFSTFNDPHPDAVSFKKELEVETSKEFNKTERFIRQADRIISGVFKLKKGKSTLENLFTLCDNLGIGPEEIKDLIKSKKIKDPKNHLTILYEELRGLYTEDWGDEL